MARVAVITPFPAPRESHPAGVRAVAHYSKALLENSEPIDGIVVYANKTHRRRSQYEDGSIRVVRCWDVGLGFPLQILLEVIRDKPKLVHLQHEFFTYVPVPGECLLVLLFVLLRLFGIRCLLTLHHIVPLSKVDREFVRENLGRFDPLWVRTGFRLLTWGLGRVATGVVVHAECFREVLVSEYGVPAWKVRVVPIGIYPRTNLPEKRMVKRQLEIEQSNVVLFFGYLAPYKGLDLLLDAADKRTPSQKDYLLVIAGGEPIRLVGDKRYEAYVSRIGNRAADLSQTQVRLTGFVPEEQIMEYFSASDVVVFPYSVCFGASGPLALAIAYQRPFLVSEPMRGLVDLEEVVFDRDPEELACAIERMLTDAALRQKTIAYARGVQARHSWGSVYQRNREIYRSMIPTSGLNSG